MADMTEQTMDQRIIMPIPAHIEAMRAMAPAVPENQVLTWGKGPYWNGSRGAVLPHHEVVFGAYAAFVERETAGQLTPDDLKNSDTLFRWATGLHPHPDQLVGLDPVRGGAMKSIFEYRLERTSQLTDEEAQKQTLVSYRTLIRAMVDSQWMKLPAAQIMDERLGYLRDCTNAEKMTLLENRIRKNAQVLLEG